MNDFKWVAKSFFEKQLVQAHCMTVTGGEGRKQTNNKPFPLTLYPQNEHPKKNPQTPTKKPQTTPDTNNKVSIQMTLSFFPPFHFLKHSTLQTGKCLHHHHSETTLIVFSQSKCLKSLNCIKKLTLLSLCILRVINWTVPCYYFPHNSKTHLTCQSIHMPSLAPFTIFCVALADFQDFIFVDLPHTSHVSVYSCFYNPTGIVQDNQAGILYPNLSFQL